MIDNKYPQTTDEMISAFIDGELTIEQQAEVQTAMDADPALAQRMAEMRAIKETLPGALKGHKDLNNILRRVDQNRPRKSAREMMPAPLRWAAVFVVVALLIIFGGVVIKPL